MLAENEANASKIEGINALIRPDQIREKIGVTEIGRREASTKDRKSIMSERPERRRDRKIKRIKRLPLSS